MNCVLYARVSTDKQAEKELSIPAQLQAMRDYASQHGWLVVTEFLEPGASAKTADRPALQRLLAACRDTVTRPGVVLVHKIDRLARNVYDHATIRALLKHHGIRLASVVENIEDTVAGQLVENIMASIAQFYSANLSEEVKKGMQQKALKGGWNHRPPRGYVLTRRGDSKIIEIHSKDGPLMQRAFELYATGWYSVKKLADRMAQEGLVSSLGTPIVQSHMRRLLANSFYAGKVHWHEHEHQGLHPALISEELFEKVQQVMVRVDRGDGLKAKIEGFPLRGVAVCSTCRGKMTAERHGRFGYYRCSRQTFRRELCAARYSNADRMHQSLERVARSIRLSKERVREISEAAEHLIIERTVRAQHRLQHRDDEESTMMREEMEVTTAFTSGDLAPNAYKLKIADIRIRRKELSGTTDGSLADGTQLSERVGRTLQMASSFWDLYEPMNDRMRREMVQALFSAVVLDHEGITGYTLRPPFDALLSEEQAGKDKAVLANEILATAA